jgi:4-hydroxymandelate oxidase
MTTAPIPPVNLAEFERAARECLDPMIYDYYAGGAEDEVTLRANRSAYERFMLRPRVLVDVSNVDPAVELFGERLSLPVLLAPAAFQRLAHPEGELASARAARAAGTLLVASTVSTHTVEQIAAAAPGPFWFQLYVFRDREITRAIVQRAEACGARALCLTTSVPVQGKRERDTRNGFRLPPDVEIANFSGSDQARLPDGQGSRLEAFINREFDPAVTWDAVEWLRSITSIPVLLKGVLAPEDAKLAVQHGVDGLIVSNHGGRQLDACIPTILALPDVVDAVEGRIPVLMDGGIRRGTDVLKALAVGAAAVMIGRPYLWGLAVGGQQGVEAVIAHLRAEIVRTFALVGYTTVKALDRSLLVDSARPSLDHQV